MFKNISGKCQFCRNFNKNCYIKKNCRQNPVNNNKMAVDIVWIGKIKLNNNKFKYIFYYYFYIHCNH